MWYRGGQFLDQDRSSVGLAKSLDGVYWQESEENLIIRLTNNIDEGCEIKGVHCVDNPFI